MSVGNVNTKWTGDTSGMVTSIDRVYASLQKAKSQLDTTQSGLQRFASQSSSAGGGLRSFESSLSSATRGIGSFSSGMLSGIGTIAKFTAGLGLGVFGIQKLASTIGSVGMSLFSFDANMEQTQTAFKGLLGSSQAANDEIQKLLKFASVTPFNFPQLVQAAQLLVGVGVAAKDVVPWMTAIGDAVAGMGGSNETIQRVTLALTQMQSAGKIGAQDMMQLTSANIPGWQILAKETGLTVAQLRDMSSNSQLLSEKYVPLLVKGMEDMFGGQMANQATTFNGLMSTLKDDLNITIGTVMGPAFERAKKGLDALTAWASSPAAAHLTDQMTHAVDQLSAKVEQVAETDGPKVVDFFKQAASHADDVASAAKTIASATKDIASFLGDVYNIADKIAGVFGGQGWEVLLGLYGISKVAPPAITAGKGVFSAGKLATSVLGGGGAAGGLGAEIPLMNVAAQVVNVNGKTTSSLGNDAKTIGKYTGEAGTVVGGIDWAATAGVAMTVIMPVAMAAAAATLVPVAINKISPAQPYQNTQAQAMPDARIASDPYLQAAVAQGVITPMSQFVSDPTDRMSHQTANTAGVSNLNANQNMPSNLDQVTASTKALDEAQVHLTASIFATTDAARQYWKDNEQVIQTVQDLSGQQWSEIQLLTTEKNSVDALAQAHNQLLAAYQDGLLTQKAYGEQESQYSSQLNAVKNAVDIVQQKQKDGIPLTQQETALLKNKDEIYGRLNGGIKDATEQEGLAAAANTELMKAQDAVNKMQNAGITSGKDYENAQKDLQTALENAKQFGLDPVTQGQIQQNQVMSDLRATLSNDLIPTLQDFKTLLANLRSPDPLNITVNSQAAIDEILRIKSLIASPNTMPFSIGTPGTTTRHAAGGTTSRPEIALVNELGPELLLFPYAGAFASGGTVGIANGGNPGLTALPAGTQVIPADKTSQLLSSITGPQSPFSVGAPDAIIQAADSWGTQMAQAMVQGMVNGLSSDQFVPQLIPAMLPSLLSVQRDIEQKLILAQLQGAPSDADSQKQYQKTLADLQTQLNDVNSLIQRWAEQNGVTVGDAMNQAIQAAIRAASNEKTWTSTLQSYSDIIGGKFIPQLEGQIKSLNAEIATAAAADAPQTVIDALKTQLETATDQLEEAGFVYDAAVKNGQVAAQKAADAAKQTTDMIGQVLANPSVVDQYKQTATQAVEAYHLAMIEGLPQATIDALAQAAKQAQDQATESGKILADATTAGYIDQVAKVSQASLNQIIGMEKAGIISATDMVDTVVKSLENGNMTLEQAASVLPKNTLSDLQALEQNLELQWAQAMASGSADAATYYKELQQVDALINKVGNSATLNAPKIGDYVQGLGVYQSPGVYINGPASDATAAATTASLVLTTAATTAAATVPAQFAEVGRASAKDFIDALKDGLTSDQGAIAGVLNAVSNEVVNALFQQAGLIKAWEKSILGDNPSADQLAALTAAMQSPLGNPLAPPADIEADYLREQKLNKLDEKLNQAEHRAAVTHQIILDGQVIWDSVSDHYETNARTRISAHGVS